MFGIQQAEKAQETRKQQGSKLGIVLCIEDGDGNRKWMAETSLEDKFWFQHGVVPKSRPVFYVISFK